MKGSIEPEPLSVSTTTVPRLLFSESLRALHVPHAFTTRQGGLSQGMFSTLNFGNPGDLPAHERDPLSTIRANQATVAAAIRASSRQLVEVHQVHGSNVLVVRAGAPAHAGPNDTRADALITDDPTRLIAVRVADCTPILLSSDDGRFVGAVHAGWRGVISGVLPHTIAAMRAVGSHDIHAAIGPCIGAAHFEVGPEVAAEFTRCFGERTPHVRSHASQSGKFLVDLQGALAEQARFAGVVALDILPLCTFTLPELFFSHRRDAGRTGRMMAMIGPRCLS